VTTFERLGRTIKQAQWKHHRALDSVLRRHGTTLVQWDALRAMADRPGASARELAAATFQSEQSFGAMAARMERTGLITRTAGGGRRIDHDLTAEGRRLLEVGRVEASRVFGSSLGVLSAAERETLQALLDRVLAAGSPD
jgi:DNA-binding MarR family transcriptional regulator